MRSEQVWDGIILTFVNLHKEVNGVNLCDFLNLHSLLTLVK